MGTIGAYAGCGLAAYLLGAIPFGYLIGRARGMDIRKVGSGNIGATNVFRCVGKSWGTLVFILDMGKGLAAAVVPGLWASTVGEGLEYSTLGLLCGCLAIVGHNWPVYLGFKGGKGVATSAGVLLGIAPAAVGIGVAVWLLAFLSTRYVSVASMLAALAVAGGGWMMYGGDSKALPAVLTGLAILAVWRHRGNIRRLMNGTENRFDFSRKRRRSTE